MHEQLDAMRKQPVSIRVDQQELDLINRAARALGRSPSDFMLEAACTEAEAVLLDRVHFRLDEQSFAEINALLDNPPPPKARLKTLLQNAAPWE